MSEYFVLNKKKTIGVFLLLVGMVVSLYFVKDVGFQDGYDEGYADGEERGYAETYFELTGEYPYPNERYDGSYKVYSWEDYDARFQILMTAIGCLISLIGLILIIRIKKGEKIMPPLQP